MVACLVAGAVSRPAEGLADTLSALGGEARGPFYLQEFVRAPGRDIAVALLDGKVLGAYSRVAAPGEWKTTTAAGGHYAPWQLDQETARLAAGVVSLFGLAFTCVDMVKADSGWLVYEVSAFGGFSGLWASGIDAASRLANYVVANIDLPSRVVNAR